MDPCGRSGWTQIPGRRIGIMWTKQSLRGLAPPALKMPWGLVVTRGAVPLPELQNVSFVWITLLVLP